MSFTMAALLVSGGTYAFVRKGSKMSLVAGCGVGALFVGSGEWMTYVLLPYLLITHIAPGLLIKAGQHKEGHGLALASSLLLLGGMAPRAVKTGKFMPAGLVASLGALSAFYQGKKVQEWW
jgi:uncharacterized membrane protein (UPF0136 family)